MVSGDIRIMILKISGHLNIYSKIVNAYNYKEGKIKV